MITLYFPEQHGTTDHPSKVSVESLRGVKGETVNSDTPTKMAHQWSWRVAFTLSLLSLTLTILKVPPKVAKLMMLSKKPCPPIADLYTSIPLPKQILTTKPAESASSSHTDSPEQLKLNQEVRSRLSEIETTVLFHCTNSKRVVIAKDISFGRYYAQRDLQGWSLAYKNFSFEVIEQSFRTSVKLSDFSVFICLGIQSQDKHCIKPASYRLLMQTQKYNQIHGLRDILWRKDTFCYTQREALSGYHGRKNFTFPCWVLPNDRERLEAVMAERETDWIVKPSGQGEGHGIFVVSSFEEITARHKSLENLVVQPLLKDPCLVSDKKFDFRTYVLVTSIAPLRAYIYKEGLVRLASSKYDRNATRGGSEQQFLTNTSVGKKYTHLANLTWTFQKLKHHFDSIGVNSEQVFEDLNEAIVRTLLFSEFRFRKDFSVSLGGYDCQNCFQLLGVDVILDSNYQPRVIEINGLPSMQLSHELGVPPDPSNPYTATKLGLMHDILQILFKPVSVIDKLMKDLQFLKVGVSPGPLCSHNHHSFCVDYKELQKIIDSKREFLNRGDFQRIYPSPNGEKYSKLIHHMHDLVLRKFGTLQPQRTLWQMHHLHTALEKLNYATL